MKNDEIMKIELPRIKVIDLEMAIQHIIFDFKDEIRNKNTTEERKRIAQSAIDHRWQPLLDEIERQFEEQDKGQDEEQENPLRSL